MDAKITAQELKAELGSQLDVLLEEVARTMNQARPGKIIADSEEGVRDAAAEFRRRLYEKALELRQKQDASSFSPSADAAAGPLAPQGPASDQLPDGQRAGGDLPDGLVEPPARKRRAR